jgi:replicative DNA helicase
MPRCPSIKDYIAIVKEKHDLRRILAACTEAIAKCYEQTGSAAEVLEEMGNGLKGIRRKKA